MIFRSILKNQKKIDQTYKSLEDYNKNSDNLSEKIIPYIHPSKIVAVGLNYYDHAEEMKKTKCLLHNLYTRHTKKSKTITGKATIKLNM